jgi:hypothetical protein
LAKNLTHEHISLSAEAWLVANANPGRALQLNATEPHLKSDDLPLIFRVAELHGVLPTVVRAAERDAAARGIEASADCRKAIEDARLKVAYYTGHGLLLTHHADRVMAAFRSSNIKAAVVKGATVAKRLYPQPALRTFGDVDVIIDPKDRPSVHEIMPSLGFEQFTFRDASDHCEDCWLLSSNKKIMVEVHTNLVHSPKLRQALSLSYHDILAAGDGDPEAATALLLVAAIHGSVGHQFERLQLVVDVVLAASGAAGPIDVDRLRDVANRNGLMMALITALDLAGRTFSDRKCQDLARQLDASLLSRLPGMILTPQLVIRTHSPNRAMHSWRRKVFRQLLRLNYLQKALSRSPNTDINSGPTDPKSLPTRSS